MIRFDEYMEQCLYGPDGFYSSGRGIAGKRAGDFITSPEVGALFGGVLARAINAWWVKAGQPDNFNVVDAGTGPGTLLKALAHAAPDCARAWTLLGVDRANGVEMPSDLTNCVVIANELLDNLVFRIVERQAAGWAEVFVQTAGDTPSEVLQPCDDPGFDLEPGQRMPLLEAATAWIDDVLDRGASMILIFDYGVESTSELAGRGGWLRTYRQHERGDDPYRDPGAWDITTDIAVDQMRTPSTLQTQADWLREWGIEDMVEEGRRYWIEHAGAPDVAAMRMRSRINEAQALLDLDGLGSWLVLSYTNPIVATLGS